MHFVAVLSKYIKHVLANEIFIHCSFACVVKRTRLPILGLNYDATSHLYY